MSVEGDNISIDHEDEASNVGNGVSHEEGKNCESNIESFIEDSNELEGDDNNENIELTPEELMELNENELFKLEDIDILDLTEEEWKEVALMISNDRDILELTEDELREVKDMWANDPSAPIIPLKPPVPPGYVRILISPKDGDWIM
jgi:hypothetical protein